MQSAPGIFGIQDSGGELICILDPIVFLEQSITIPFDSLIHCKYCKSYVEISGSTDKSECGVCKCWNDIKRKEGEEGIVGQINNLSNNQNKSAYGNEGNVFLTYPKTPPPPLKLIVIIQSKLCSQIATSLQSLESLLPTLPSVHVTLIIYDNQIKLIQLQPDGRILIINSQCMSLINDKIYPYGDGSCLKKLLEVVGEDWSNNKVLLNGSRVVSDVVGSLQKDGLGLILWFGNVDDSTVFCEWPSLLNLEVYPILIIPKKFKTVSAFSSIQKRNTSRLTTKYILDDDKIGDKVHYYLWEIFGNQPTLGQRIEASHEKKFPPQILTTKRRVLGSFKNCVIVNMGKTMNKNEIGQVRIWFMGTDKQQNNVQKQEVDTQGQQLLKANEGYKLLIINFSGQIFDKRPRKQMQRYMQLFRLAKKNPSNMQLRQINYQTNTLVDLSQFFMECSYLQKHEIFCSIQNPHCIYAVWPWVGLIRNSKCMRDSIKLVYYFTGYNHNKNENMSEHIDQLNRLCNICYCNEDLYMPRYYQNIIEQIAPPSHLIDSDEESEIQERYYKYYVD